MNENWFICYAKHNFTDYVIAVVRSQMATAGFFCVVCMKIILIPLSILYLLMASIDHPICVKKMSNFFKKAKSMFAFRDEM